MKVGEWETAKPAGHTLRFSEMTPERIAQTDAFEVIVPDVSVTWSFYRRPLSSDEWSLDVRTREFPFDPDNAMRVVNKMTDERVFGFYCGLILTLCAVVGRTYDDVIVTAYYKDDKDDNK